MFLGIRANLLAPILRVQAIRLCSADCSTSIAREHGEPQCAIYFRRPHSGWNRDWHLGLKRTEHLHKCIGGRQ